MSRIGRMPVAIPAGVTVTIAENNNVTVKGPKGTLVRDLPVEMEIKEEDGHIVVTRPNDLKKMKSLHGLTRTLIHNMIQGVTEGYEKKLEVNGVGYRAQKQGKNTLSKIDEKDDWLRKIDGIVIMDENMTGQDINGVPVVADIHTMMKFIKNEIVDEVYIDVTDRIRERIKPMVMELEDMGVTVHLKIEVLDVYRDFDAKLGYLGSIPVITFANRIYSWKSLFVKRCIDIVGAIVGLVFMTIAMIFVAPAIKIESKGPLFFKQKRVGKNGRYFYIYKFRSMYIDAEERKKELMAQNEMNGLMFKMKDDPRITKVGKFIRKTSIDELPQFINVLKGDMSLVGTRPPTVGEFKQYKGHHKRRLSMKPGITGMWQAYGRNSVMDFDEVVKMDLEYIDNWSILLDIKILFKTVATVFTNHGT